MKFSELLSHYHEGSHALGAVEFDLSKDERWRYTDLKSLNQQFHPVQKRTAIDHDQLNPFLLDGFSRIVFINGLYSDKDTVVTESLKFQMGLDQKISFDPVNPFASATRELSALNGINLEIKGGQHKLQILHLVTNTKDTALLPLINISITGGGELTLVDQFIAFDGATYFNNGVIDLTVGENSGVDYYRLARDTEAGVHLNTVNVDLKRDARFNSFECTTGATLQRSNLTVLLNGENSESELYALYPLKDKRHADFHTVISHEKPHTRSKQLYKGVLAGSSRGFFDGSIVVKQDAQKIDSDQLNQNLLLSDTARVFTKPQLEIAADDVKCTHGATSGQVDPMELFYLQTRGISRAQGLKMLAKAFADQVIFTIKEPAVQKLILKQLEEQFWGSDD